MINNNKILTVSYGTFSCTLEGFDDSFGTMKAIAEYFRDLSADDRYFGAEPAQPDAQMLARIAQREISRHVEAREDEGRIVLSAQEGAQATALAASQVELKESPVTPAVEAVVSTPTLDDLNEADVAPEMDVSDEVSEHEEINDQISETIAASAAAIKEDIIENVEEHELDIVPSLPDAEVEAFFADSKPTVSEEEAGFVDLDDRSAEMLKDRANADSIADKLKRIRAVVSRQPDAAEEPDYSEDQHADAAAAKPVDVVAPITDFGDDDYDFPEDEESDVIADTLRDLEDALDADDASEAQTASLENLESEDDDISEILKRLEQEAGVNDTVETVDQDDTDTDDGMGGDDILAAMDSLVAAPEDEDLDDLDDGSLFDSDNVAETEEPVAAAPAPRTRVLKVKRATLEAAIKAGKLEEYDDASSEVDDSQKSSLSDQAEEELARDLANLEADMKAEVAPEAPPAMGNLEEDETDFSAAELPENRGAANDDLSRLLAETDSQMDEPEGANRRDAFTHLRAAVAAKKADEAVGGSLVEEETDEAYRDDLTNVVRPRRPSSNAGARTERPAEQRPAPLKLVAEQRIDVVKTQTITPVRPRRVAAVAPAPTQEAAAGAASFTDFAADVGAVKLPDVLEAAVAYLSFVEGHEQFSRPQLMTKVRQVEKENFTREDSLRSFGKLLREGKIEKLKGGRFQASDQIGYKPDARAAS